MAVASSTEVVVSSIRGDIRGDRMFMASTSGDSFGQESVSDLARNQSSLVGLSKFFLATVIDHITGAFVVDSRNSALESVVINELFGELCEIAVLGSADRKLEFHEVRARNFGVVSNVTDHNIVIALISIVVSAFAVLLVRTGLGATTIFVLVCVMVLLILAVEVGARVASLSPLAVAATARFPYVAGAGGVVSVDAKFALALLPPAAIVVFSSVLIRPVLRKTISQRIEVSGLRVIHPILSGMEIKRIWVLGIKIVTNDPFRGIMSHVSILKNPHID